MPGRQISASIWPIPHSSARNGSINLTSADLGNATRGSLVAEVNDAYVDIVSVGVRYRFDSSPVKTAHHHEVGEGLMSGCRSGLLRSGRHLRVREAQERLMAAVPGVTR